MCGIFGAIGKNIDLLILQEIAVQARKRGPHAYGISWYENEEICTRKKPTAINPQKAFHGIQCSAIIGHCRLATSGSYKDIANNQPMVMDDLAISHNGNIRSYLQIAKSMGIELKTHCDSEIICHMIKKFGVNETLKRLDSEMPMALLLLQKEKIITFRKGQPLYVQYKDGCFYFCSRKFLNAELMEEGKVIMFDVEGGKKYADNHNEIVGAKKAREECKNSYISAVKRV